jgi:hypothetical protein
MASRTVVESRVVPRFLPHLPGAMRELRALVNMSLPTEEGGDWDELRANLNAAKQAAHHALALAERLWAEHSGLLLHTTDQPDTSG